jgi:putative DNA primase/helicase
MTPSALAVVPNRIPPKMRGAWRWVVWRFEQRDGRWTKVLYSPNTGRRASSINPGTWGTFEQACAALATGRYAGLGFVLGGGFAGVDKDKCRDAHTGEIATWALALIDRLDSYTEASPSGTGVHVFVSVDPSWQLPGRKLVRPDGSAIEIYGAGRYFTVTGHTLNDAPLAERTDALRELISETFGPDTSTPAAPPAWIAGYEGAGTENITDADLPRSVAEISDDELLDRMLSAENGEHVRTLFDGDTRGDHSAADLALCSHLAFWTQRDPERIDRLFRRSRLMRAKWNRADYRRRTIERAINSSEIYEPPIRPIVAEAAEAEAI